MSRKEKTRSELIDEIVKEVNLSRMNHLPEAGNRTLIQFFEWYLPVDGQHWNRTAEAANKLATLGFTDVWLPPAYKGHVGMMDVGYGVYDLYDLGEFYQKGVIPTKYGTKAQYLNAIDTLHKYNLRVMADMVLNHRMGADYCEDTYATPVERSDRYMKIAPKKKVQVWTGFTFPGRNGKYSDFEWNDDHFSSVDYNALTDSSDFIFKLMGHGFSPKVANENGNYDYLMGADVDFDKEEVVEELEYWGKWYLDTTGCDSLRLDAVKHITYEFFPHWLGILRRYEYEKAMNLAKAEAEKRGLNFDEIRDEIKDQIKGKELFAVGEYWRDNLNELTDYLWNCGHCMSLFDVPLHHRFQKASLEYEKFDLRTIFDGTLLACDPVHAVTFVDNHDTQPGQALESWVKYWFKPLAYALILLREQGTPCVFYGDLYGIDHNGLIPVRELENLLLARRRYAHGHQEDYFDHPNTIGWTRGDNLGVVMSNGEEGWKDMKLGWPGQTFVDMLGNRKEEIVIGDDGKGHFTCNARSVSVWIPKK